ncbi:P44/Msp2 family outer membrane protein [Neoehrlichia mikurensis]|uniref:P44/Msp2 family outer membrane protein n=1 Tax=Neoehrlichia mikurensis TaxID=89586 RepID=UPI001C4448EA|nr:P44/Msp2 family outer membrane protein [Neoehrlichia mikurensis]QXK93282.1 P44/Msp2 family outer membrane protein [Neoehrlichia mikurensis]
MIISDIKKSFLAVYLLVTMVLPLQAFSIDSVKSLSQGNFYINGSYEIGFFDVEGFSISEMSIDNNVTKTKTRFQLKHDSQEFKNFTDLRSTGFSNKYKPTVFDRGYLNFAGSIGYSRNNIRMELECSYENSDVLDDGKYAEKENRRIVALVRGDNVSIDTSGVNYIIVKNKGIADTSFTFNVCYDIVSEYNRVVPYLCAGAGGDFISMFDVVRMKFSYQGKIGLSYKIAPNMIAFVHTYYHDVIGNRFDYLKTIVYGKLKDAPQVTSASVSADIKYMGVSLGIRFML